jgi:hypothetical protein
LLLLVLLNRKSPFNGLTVTRLKAIGVVVNIVSVVCTGLVAVVVDSVCLIREFLLSSESPIGSCCCIPSVPLGSIRIGYNVSQIDVSIKAGLTLAFDATTRIIARENSFLRNLDLLIVVGGGKLLLLVSYNVGVLLW